MGWFRKSKDESSPPTPKEHSRKLQEKVSESAEILQHELENLQRLIGFNDE